MGCGASTPGQIADTNSIQPIIARLTQEKAVIYEDRLCLATEVTQMKTYVSEMVMENEMLKVRVDKVMSSANPLVFQDSSSQDELIADWVEMDLRDGDRLLEALTEIHPESRDEILAVLQISADLRKVDSSLKQYCDYFSRRFEFYNEIWAKAFQAKLALEEVIKQFKSEMATGIQSVESMLGKRSPPLMELQAQFRELIQLKGAAFFLEYRNLTLKIFGHKVDNFNKKLEEKDAERQKVIAWYETEIGKMKTAHAEELMQKDKERNMVVTEMQTERDKLVSSYERTITDLSTRADQDKDRLIWQYNEDRALLKSKLDRKTRELQEIQSTADKELQAVIKKTNEEKQALLTAHERAMTIKDRNIRDMKDAIMKEAERREVEVKQASEGWNEQLQVLVNEHVQEFAKLQRKLDFETEKHDLAVRKLENAHKQQLSSLESQRKQELEGLRSSLTQEIQRRDEILKKTQTESQDYMSKMIEKHRDDMAKLYANGQTELKKKDEVIMAQRDTHQRQLDALTAKHNSDLEELRTTLNEEVYKRDLSARKMEQNHQSALQELMDKFRDDVEKLRLTHQAELRTKEEQLMEADRKYADITEQFRKEMADLRTFHSEEITKWESILEKTKEEHRANIDTVRAELYEELAQLRTQHAEEIRAREAVEKKLEASHNTAIQELMDKYREDTERLRLQSQQDIQAKDQQLATTTQLHQQQMETLMSKKDKEIKDLRESYVEELRRKEDALDKIHETHRAELRSLLQKAAQEADSQQQLFSQDSRTKALQLQTLQQDYEAKLTAQDKRHTAEINEVRQGFLTLLQEKEELARKIKEDNDVKFEELAEKYREDLLLARKQLVSDNVRKEENVDKMQAEYEQQLSELVDKHSNDLARVRSEYTEEQNRKERLHREALTAAESALTAATEKLKTEIDTLRKQHAQELQTLQETAQKNRVRFETQLAELRETHFQEIQNLRTLQSEELQRRDALAAKQQEEQSAYIASLMDKYRSDLMEARRVHQEDIEKKDSEIGNLQSEYQANVTGMMKKHAEEIATVRGNHSEEIRRKEMQIETLVKNTENRLREVHNQHLMELNQVKEAQLEELKSRSESQQRVVAGYEAQLAALRSQLTTDLHNSQSQHRSESEQYEIKINLLKKEHKSEIEAVMNRLMDDFAAQKKTLEAEIRAKEQLLEEIKRKNEQNLQELKMKHLEHIKGLEAAQALAAAEHSHKEKEQAASLQRTLEEFLKQTAFIKALHQQDRVETVRRASPHVSPAISRMDPDPTEEGLYQKVLLETQEALEKEKRALDLQLARDREVIRNLESKNEEMKTNLLTQQQEIDSLTHKISDLEAQIAHLNTQNASLLDELDTEKDERMKLQTAHNSLKSELEVTISHLQDTTRDRDSLSSALFDSKTALFLVKSELDSHKGLTWKEQQDLQVQLQRALEDLSHRDAKIMELAENVRGQETDFLEQMRRQVLKAVLLRTLLQIRSLKSKTVTIWRLNQPKKQPNAPAVRSVVSSQEEAVRLWESEQRSLLDNNSLLDVYKKVAKGETPLGLTQVLKFFEELMDHKAEADQLDISAHRQPKSLQDFLIDHLTRTFGLRKLALKMVCQLVPALVLYHREQQPEIVLFCRLLQIINPNPVCLPLTVFVTKVRTELGKYCRNYQVEHGGNGGKAYLVDAFAYVYAVFEEDREAGTELLRRLRPATVSLSDYILFCICNKMAILSLNSEEVFNKMDLDTSGRMSQREFVSGVQQILELWISENDLETVFTSLAGARTSLSPQEFITSLGFRNYVEKCKSEEFAITKTEFLTAMIEVYAGKQVRNVKDVLGELKTYTSVDRTLHDSLLSRLNPVIDREQRASLWTKASETAGTGNIPVTTYIRFLLRSAALPQGVFGRIYTVPDDLHLWTELTWSDDQYSDSSGTRRWVVKEEV